MRFGGVVVSTRGACTCVRLYVHLRLCAHLCAHLCTCVSTPVCERLRVRARTHACIDTGKFKVGLQATLSNNHLGSCAGAC